MVGSADIDVPMEHSQHAASAISGAETLVMDGGTHLSLFAHPDASFVQALVVATLR